MVLYAERVAHWLTFGVHENKRAHTTRTLLTVSSLPTFMHFLNTSNRSHAKWPCHAIVLAHWVTDHNLKFRVQVTFVFTLVSAPWLRQHCAKDLFNIYFFTLKKDVEWRGNIFFKSEAKSKCIVLIAIARSWEMEVHVADLLTRQEASWRTGESPPLSSKCTV